MTGMPEATGLGVIHPDNVFGLVIGVKVQTCGIWIKSALCRLSMHERL